MCGRVESADIMDWADEKAKEILFEEIIEKEGQWTVVIAQALRDAKAKGRSEGIEEAARLVNVEFAPEAICRAALEAVGSQS